MFWLGVIIRGSVENFCSSKDETMPSAFFFSIFDGIAIILSWTFHWQHKISLITKTQQTHVRLQIFLRVNSFTIITCCKAFYSHKISCSSQSGSFLRSSKKGLRMKENLQQSWQSILQKLLVLISYSSQITEKKTGHSPKTSPYFGLTSFLSWKINRKNLQTAQSNCIKFCQKGSRNGLSNIQQTYSTKISTKTNVNSDILRKQQDSSCLRTPFFWFGSLKMRFLTSL